MYNNEYTDAKSLLVNEMKKKDILNIFKSFGFAISYDAMLGDLIEMGVEDAFVFASITGSPYLISKYGIGVKGRSEVFIHRSIFQNEYYIYSPGLFTRDIKGCLKEGNSARRLKREYPQIFSGKKFIYIQDISKDNSSNIERQVYEYLLRNKKSPEDIILMKNFETGSSGEPFLEYLASILFINQGYVVENQAPWFQQAFKYQDKVINGGIPDFSAFKSSILSYLNKIAAIENDKGVPLTLLPVIHNFRNIREAPGELSPAKQMEYKLILGEAKTAASSLPSALKQLRQYKQVNLANELYTIIPDVKNNRDDKIGEIFLENDKIIIGKSGKKLIIDKDHQTKDNEWCDNYIKILLLGNIDFDKIENILKEYRINSGQKPLENYEAHHLVDFVLNTPNHTFFPVFLRSL